MRYLLIILMAVFAIAQDSDFDGVPDKLDKCPNTPLLAIVDKNGCKIKDLSPAKFLLYAGFERDFIKNKAYNSYYTGGYMYKDNIQLGYFMSKYKIKSYKTNITNISAALVKHKFKFKLKVYFPTYYNDKYYFSYYLKYYSFVNISFEHKTKNLKNNDCLYVSKGFKIRDFYFKLYNYIYLNNSYNYFGIYLKYPINKKLAVSLDNSTGTNNDKRDYYISTTLSYYF